MNNQRRLALAAYFAALLVVITPLFDAAMSLYPWDPASSQWRFGAVGLLSNALLIPLIGGVILVATAVSQGDATMLRVLRVLSWVMAAVILISMVAFALDSLQNTLRIRPEMVLAFRVASATATFKLLLAAVTFVLFARASRSEKIVRQDSGASGGLVLKHRGNAS